MKFCDDCKWCSVNFVPSKEEARKYRFPKLEKRDPCLYQCAHPESSKSARFDCNWCNVMRLEHQPCKKEAVLFEEKENVE